MEKRSRRRIRDLVARPASLGLSENEIGCARISMMARNTNVPFKGRIQKRKTYHLQIITFRLQRAAGPYRSAMSRHSPLTTFQIAPVIRPPIQAPLLHGWELNDAATLWELQIASDAMSLDA
jgi:hypothetical protein